MPDISALPDGQKIAPEAAGTLGLDGTIIGADDPRAVNATTVNGFIISKDSLLISVKQFGAVGDGVTDDTAAFVAARNAWKAAIRTNPAPSSDGNKLGGYPAICVPPGSYLIKTAGAMLDSSFTTRTVGMKWMGTGAPGEWT